VVNEQGELQLTDYGISGIPVFQISRFIKRELDRKNNPVVHINFMPDYNDRKLGSILTGFVGHNPSLEIKDVLNGILNKKISPVILKQSGIKPSEICKNITPVNIKSIVKNILDFKVTPTDTNGFDNAQVCAGGVDLSQVNLETMESKIVKNLYFAGEILDVDGKCGGYNLQWAFSSGRLAGLNAVR
jgi:predicted Rossmann fold flavoprotein